MLFNDNQLDDLIKKSLSFLPDDLGQARKDLEKNIKSAFEASLARMDLVTREEFDTQAELLSRTRATLDELENKLIQMEKLLNEKNPD